MAIPWTPALAIGVPEIDHQHQELFVRIERLVEGVARGNPADVERLLEFLSQYVVKHFGAEERWMLRSAYPDYARHKAQHERFIRDYEHMTQEFREKGPNVLVGHSHEQLDRGVAEAAHQPLRHGTRPIPRDEGGERRPRRSVTHQVAALAPVTAYSPSALDLEPDPDGHLELGDLAALHGAADLGDLEPAHVADRLARGLRRRT